MVLNNLFAGQQWRNRHREQTYGHGERGEEGEMYGMTNLEIYSTICKIAAFHITKDRAKVLIVCFRGQGALATFPLHYVPPPWPDLLLAPNLFLSCVTGLARPPGKTC